MGPPATHLRADFRNAVGGRPAAEFGNASAVIGLRLQIQTLEETDHSVEKGVVAVARHHVRRADDIGEPGVGQSRDEGLGRLARHQFAQLAPDEMHRKRQPRQSGLERVGISQGSTAMNVRDQAGIPMPAQPTIVALPQVLGQSREVRPRPCSEQCRPG